jgi:hypothetical protein
LLLSFGSWDRSQLVRLNIPLRYIVKPSYPGTEPIAKRVCLEQRPVVRTMMLYKRWKAQVMNCPHVSSEPNRPMNNSKREERTFIPTCRDQKEFANHLMLLKEEMLLVVNDKEKWERRFLKMRVEELNRVNSRLKPRNVKE